MSIAAVGTVFCLWLAAASVHGQFGRPVQATVAGTGPCRMRPIGCNLNCPNGFAWGLANTCLCICQLDPCLNKVCPMGEICMTRRGETMCVSQLVSHERTSSTPTVGECPKLVGGLCLERCRSDSECLGQMKCCSNGCGRECVLPVNVAPIMNTLRIQPIAPSFAPARSNAIAGNSLGQVPVHSHASYNASWVDKIGSCPAKTALKDRKCEVECNRDADCAGLAKCCDSGCGRSCTAPEKATTCVHLLSAVERLPLKELANGYVPICSPLDGNFQSIQCDLTDCWCVQVFDGFEIFGTKVPKESRFSLNCNAPRSCQRESQCDVKRCPFGPKTDSAGCPLANCECRNICESVSCENKFDECQLVEPDCAKTPCAPVPRCLLNPCSNGLPMTLPSGVTALCTQTSQCWNNFWCHQIGYNGLGFCCPGPESAARQGFCEARVPRHMSDCAAECRSDVDCDSTSKCCFDGCGLKCMNVHFSPNPFQHRPAAKSEIVAVDSLRANKEILSQLIAECPEVSVDNSQQCQAECKSNDDCKGLKQCCVVGCSRLCVYAQKTTRCIHVAITHDLYFLKNQPRCTPAGNFDEIQCADGRCFCVDPITGIEIPNTWVPAGNNPACKAVTSSTCQILSCPNFCPFGHALGHDGCPTCDCKNPCADVRCPQGQICIMSDITCFHQSNCPAQPRCIPNVCDGHPYANANGLVEQCGSTCPEGFWCNNVGFAGHGGVCCPEIVASAGNQQVVQPRNVVHAGRCIKTQVTMDLLPEASECRMRCRLDSECAAHSKCCFDGCGLRCIQVADDVSSAVVARPDTVSTVASIRPVNAPSKLIIGECPVLPAGPRLDCRSGVDSCRTDQDCEGIRKCCSDGCFKRCLFAQKTTPCLHMKAALQKTKHVDEIKCTKAGEFEEVQCDGRYCWCVDQNGMEVTGTKVSTGLRPDCRVRRFCEEPKCRTAVACPYGRAKDSNGCDTCKCFNPCDRTACPNGQLCVPHPVECLSGVCPPVPKCMVNVCGLGQPILHDTSGEPVFCREHAQCRGADTYCRVFKNNGGYCCTGTAPSTHAGSCPKPLSAVLYPSVDDSCSISCNDDDDCEADYKCCDAGDCSVKCMPAESVSDTAAPLQGAGRKIGECPTVDDLTSRVCGSARVNTCQDDNDCPSVHKCCFDGCAKTCQDAEVTTECLHAKAAFLALKRANVQNVFEPLCDADGAFERIQHYRGYYWCVDAHGKEMAGTRVNHRAPDCARPRSCPVMSCRKQCLLGPEMLDTGCPTCECKNPCRTLQCPLNHVCRVVSIQCFVTTCTPVARCILNACPRGEPLERADNGQLAECDNSDAHKCPQGWFCHRIGMASIGYCCPGSAPVTQVNANCPLLPILHRPRQEAMDRLECRLNHDCIGNGPCCFNGAGTSCKIGVRHATTESPVEHSTLEPIRAVTAITPNSEKLGVCPNNPISNPGCRSDCTRDSECKDFQKCCAYGCGRICQYPQVATACIHKLSAVMEEMSKLIASSSELLDARSNLKPTVQCTSSGLFRKIQCDAGSRQCWCVDIHSGVEIIGTRVSGVSGAEPNCLTPRFCATSCHELNCEHGYRLDKSGCPLDGFCQCKTPCEDLKCAKETDICVLRKASCLSPVCPMVAVCRSNPCPSGHATLKDTSGLSVACSSDRDCGRGQCHLLVGEQQKGVCCPLDSRSQGFTSETKVGSCPARTSFPIESSHNCTNECTSDAECSGVEKCCEYGCNKLCVGPINATNCVHTLNAIEAMLKDGATVQLHKPQCEARSGLYMTTQCDEQLCWCVDTVTGIEFHGTRSSDSSVNVCSLRKTCPILCDDRRTCPFGFETNSQGCPRSSNCRCRNPCDQIQCPSGQVCLLRPTHSCQDQSCMSVPTCERNPCGNNQRPAVEPQTYTQFTCLENKTQICPTGFYCTSYDQAHVGVCCPGQEPILAHHGTIATCPHGDAFSSQPDGSPTECHVNESNCPSTHYCLSKPNRNKGICCVTKRYVCNLDADRGSCSATVPRFFYNSETQKCESFAYGGCSGNLNNFATASECERFCVGTGVDILNTMMNDDTGHAVDVFHMGFSLTGPLKRERHTTEINQVFRDYLTENFAVDESEIRDLFIKDDNTVRFTIHSPNAKEKADNISTAVSSGKFRFSYKGDMYKAEPQTWFLQQVEEQPMQTLFTDSFVFWALMIACVLFALVVLVALCCGCTFLQRKRLKDSASTVRGASPSPYGQISAYVPHGTVHSPARSGGSISQYSVGMNLRRGTKKQVLSTDDVNAMRQNAAGGGNNLLTPVPSIASADGRLVGPHTQGGRRPSRATLYY